MDKSKYTLNPKLKEKLKQIPASSGVYMMFNKKDEVIYIGKAKNLKDRVRTYLNTNSWDSRPKLYYLMPKVFDIKALITNSEREALILEANLVYKYQPKYNVTLKDDKKFPWLMITHDEKYPRVVPIRDIARFKTKNPNTKNKFFGPYSDTGAMWETYKILKEGFQLRLRRKPLFKDRPCMNYHIGLCSGPCQQLISDENYFDIVKQVEGFLLGKYSRLIKDLKFQMAAASKKMEYEKAAKIRDTIKKIEKVLEKQIVVSDDTSLNQDVFACDWSEEIMILQLYLVREGKVIAVESLNLNLPKDSNFKNAFSQGIKLYYANVDKKNIGEKILVQFEIPEKKHIEEWLSERLGKKVKIVSPQRGKNLELLKIVEQNAKLTLQKVLQEKFLDDLNKVDFKSVLIELKEKLFLKNIPNKIECFDISHLGGTGTVASMVSFLEGKPDKNKYRKFKIKTLLKNKIDDFHSMREVIERRYLNLDKNDFPDLIIIDGGKGQLSSACESLEKVGVIVNEIDIIGLAKKDEEVFKPGKKNSIYLERESKALHLLQKVRDEAHRFAVTFQREIRLKDTFTNELEKISGLGKAKIKKLMNYYGSVKNIQDSDLKTFVSVLNQKEDSLKEVFSKIKNIT